MEKKSKLEALTSSWPITLAATGIGACGGVIGAFLPFLTGSLAQRRHIERIEKAIRAIEEYINKHDLKLKELTDSQYKIIGEAINCMLSTVNEEKIEYLKRAVKNSFNDELDSELGSEAEVLTRILRDVSAKEAEFIVNRNHEGTPFSKIALYSYKREPDTNNTKTRSTSTGSVYSGKITIYSSKSGVSGDCLYISRVDNETVEFISRLLFLGMLRKSDEIKNNEIYLFTVVADKLKKLLSE